MAETQAQPAKIRHYRRLAKKIVQHHFGQPPSRIVYRRTGLSNYVLGEQTGTENVTLLQNQMPMHTHQVQASTTNGSSSTAQNAVPATAAPARGQSSGPDIYGTAVNTTMNPQMISASGGSQPHENMQPSLCVSFIIALQGIYPSRS